MKEQIYKTLNNIHPTFYKEAPDDYINLPVILYYYVVNKPLYRADNRASKERRIIFNVDVFDDVDVDDVVTKIINDLETIKAVLINEEDITDNGIFGVRLEFEMIDFN